MKKSFTPTLLGLFTLSALGYAAEMDLSKVPAASTRKDVTYAKDIRPILEASCFGCHGPERQKGGLRLDSLESALKGSEDGKVINPGQSLKSHLLIAVSQIDEEKAMPPKFKPGRGGPGGGPGGPPPPSGQPGQSGGGGGQGEAQRPGGGPPGGGPGKGFGPPPKPLTTEQVGLVRAWIDLGAK
jgi:hypothetical protein